MPSTTEARPPRCLGCGAASRPHGATLVVHGDGTRERQVRGPPSATAAPELGTVRVRRFECQQCGVCMIVVPRELLPRRLYTACAIGLALTVWALMGATEAETRARVSPFAIVGATAQTRWITLRRWATDAGAGRLLSTARAPPAGFMRRQHAERAAAALVALAPPGLTLDAAAFAGAARHFR
jgi:hypothetical protein